MSDSDPLPTESSTIAESSIEQTLPPAPASSHPPAELSRALQAFKKRLKLTQLDSESKLGYGPMTGGQSSGIVAITPPNQYPRSVWDALVAQGKLKKGSQGQYELVRGPAS
jgi:hypothetical protein